ncbi:G-type lectin S-receptor-like serine/threonine-protein kinase [Acorus gramineus]|uniref:G-type lectin S-receptor-like serine/threonine-protein kinase n=1 Tax=Acorus gramineus TaxID=55184 RepID=A0AAV9A6J6_ACOGR|nr:G-type lectin S-receptor-like serine/threonine-protein kinase [Acorus gramineus]
MDPAKTEVRIDYSNLRRTVGLPVDFSYAFLKAATGGFSDLLGRGASGAVFKGVLEDRTPVAVRRHEFSAVAAVRHVNLVRLLGFCTAIADDGPNYLVYEFVPNGSLDAWIWRARARHVPVVGDEAPGRGRRGEGARVQPPRLPVADTAPGREAGERAPRRGVPRAHDGFRDFEADGEGGEQGRHDRARDARVPRARVVPRGRDFREV